jgi:hypothetical protein
MKILFENYTFDASTKKVTFNTTDTVTLEKLLIITNVTTNTIIYNFADPLTGGAVLNNVLTLDYDTTGMSDNDKLQIFLDNSLTPASEESLQYLKKIAQLVAPLSVQDANQRQRVAIDASTATVTVGGTITTVSTVSTVSNIGALGGVDPRFQFTDAARLTYAQGIRNNLSFN